MSKQSSLFHLIEMRQKFSLRNWQFPMLVNGQVRVTKEGMNQSIAYN